MSGQLTEFIYDQHLFNEDATTPVACWAPAMNRL